MLAAVLAMAWAGAAVAQDTASFDFETGDLAGWEAGPGVDITDGVLRVAPGSMAVAPGTWGDLDLQVSIRSQEPGEVFIHYHLGEQGRHTAILLPGEVILEHERSGAVEPVASAGYEGLPAGEWADLRITASGTHHTVSLDGRQLLDVEDPEGPTTGALGFSVDGGQPVEFDDVVVAGVSGPAAPEGEQPAPGDDAPEPGLVATPATEGTTATTVAGTGDEGWLDSLFSGQPQAGEIGTFVVNLLLAALLSFVLGLVYTHWGTSLSNRRRFAANFMLISITTTFIILVVRSSVALSLGLVGALSIVRFRAAIKEPEELAYLFLAVGLGIGLGDNQRLITIVALALAIVFIGVRRLFHTRASDVNLHLTVGGGGGLQISLPEILAALRAHTRRVRLIRFDEGEPGFEASLLVEFREIDDLHAAHAALQALSPGLDITFLDNQVIGA